MAPKILQFFHEYKKWAFFPLCPKIFKIFVRLESDRVLRGCCPIHACARCYTWWVTHAAFTTKLLASYYDYCKARFEDAISPILSHQEIKSTAYCACSIALKNIYKKSVHCPCLASVQKLRKPLKEKIRVLLSRNLKLVVCCT